MLIQISHRWRLLYPKIYFVYFHAQLYVNILHSDEVEPQEIKLQSLETLPLSSVFLCVNLPLLRDSFRKSVLPTRSLSCVDRYVPIAKRRSRKRD